MDRKRAKAGNSQASRPKRLRFHGNQYIVEEDVDNPRTSGNCRAREISTLLFRILLILLLLLVLLLFLFASDDLLKRCFKAEIKQ